MASSYISLSQGEWPSIRPLAMSKVDSDHPLIECIVLENDYFEGCKSLRSNILPRKVLLESCSSVVVSICERKVAQFDMWAGIEDDCLAVWKV